MLDFKPELAKAIGVNIAKMHNKDIIHGDLTTSNMILDTENEICLIDFGLSFFSKKIEDKAVDIHLFKQALESKHYKVFDKAYSFFLKGYEKEEDFKAIINRLDIVEERGRYKKK